jgi:hypothetical protein
VKAILVRKEKSNEMRQKLIAEDIEFYEERDNFHYLFIFPDLKKSLKTNGKHCYLLNGEIDEVETQGKTFRIEGRKEMIDLFAPKFEKRGLKVNLDNPDIVVEVRKWGKRYLVSVS